MAQIGAIINPMIAAMGTSMTTGPLGQAFAAYGPLATFGASLFGAFSAKSAADRMADAYDNQADAAREHAEQSARRQRTLAKEYLGSTRAQFAGAGLMANTGSPLEVLSGMAGQLEEDAFLIEQGGTFKEKTYSMQASAQRESGRGQLIGGMAKAGGTLLGSFPEMMKSPLFGSQANAGSADFRVSSMLV